MNRFDKFLNKNQNRLLGVFVIAILSWVIGKLLDLFSSNSSGLLKVLKFKVNIPLFAILLSLAVFWLFYLAYKNWKIGKHGLKIIKAKYGSGDSFVDITSELNSRVIDDKLNIVIDNSIAGDPLPGTLKKALITFSHNGKTDDIEVRESDTLKIA